MNDKIKEISDQRRKKKTVSMEDAIKRAAQHIRNVGGDKLMEPEGFVSGGDMRKILEEDENDDCHEKRD
jgi:hypothetical protein